MQGLLVTISLIGLIVVILVYCYKSMRLERKQKQKIDSFNWCRFSLNWYTANISIFKNKNWIKQHNAGINPRVDTIPKVRIADWSLSSTLFID